MKRIWERIEWALWQKLLPESWHRWFTTVTMLIMRSRLGEEDVEHWCWAMTPMPMGFPFPHQHWNGIRMAVAGPKKAWRIAKEYEVRMDEEHRRFKAAQKERERDGSE